MRAALLLISVFVLLQPAELWAAEPPAAGATAEPPAGEGGLTLTEALAAARGRSASVAAAGERAAALGIGRETAADGLELRMSQSDILSAGEPRAQAALRLRWEGLAVGAAERARQGAEVSAATAEAQRLLAELDWSVERRFAAVLLLEAELARRLEAEQAWSAVAAGVARRAELGADSALDVVDAKLRAVEAAGRRRGAEAALQAARAELNATLGGPPGPPLRLIGPPPSPRARPEPSVGERASEAERAAAEAKLARARTLPRVDFVQAGVEGGPTPGAQVSMALRLPLLDGSLSESKEQRALAAALQSTAAAVASEAAAEAEASAAGIEAGLSALRAQARALAEARAALPPVGAVEPLPQAELRGRLSELEAELLARERALWP